MKQVNHSEFLAILEKGNFHNTLEELAYREINVEEMETIEIAMEIEDEGTEDECIYISEFNMYTKNTVIFGVMLKHENDFTIQWAPRNPLTAPKENK